MTISLVPATIEDAALILPVGLAAFAQDKLNTEMFNFNTASGEQLDEFRRWRLEVNTVRLSGEDKHWIKAIDDSNGCLAGYTGIYEPCSVTPDVWEKRMPACTNLDIVNELRPAMKAAKERQIGEGEGVWCKSSSLAKVYFLRDFRLTHSVRYAIDGRASGLPGTRPCDKAVEKCL